MVLEEGQCHLLKSASKLVKITLYQLFTLRKKSLMVDLRFDYGLYFYFRHMVRKKKYSEDPRSLW